MELTATTEKTIPRAEQRGEIKSACSALSLPQRLLSRALAPRGPILSLPQCLLARALSPWGPTPVPAPMPPGHSPGTPVRPPWQCCCLLGPSRYHVHVMPSPLTPSSPICSSYRKDSMLGLGHFRKLLEGTGRSVMMRFLFICSLLSVLFK